MEIHNVSALNPQIFFEANKIEDPAIVRLALSILTKQTPAKDIIGRKVEILTDSKHGKMHDLFAPLMKFLKKTLNIPLSDDELATKIQKFVEKQGSVEGKNLTTGQIQHLSKQIFSAIKEYKCTSKLSGKVQLDIDVNFDMKKFFQENI